MLLNNFPDTFTLVQIHYNDEYGTAWGNTRASFYSVSGTPAAWFDGVLQCVGAYSNVTQQYNWYLTQYNSRRAQATDVVMQIETSGTGVITVNTTVSREAGTGGAKAMRVHVVKVLDHWPTSGGYHRNGFRDAAPAVDISLLPGESQVLVSTFTLDSLDQSHLDDVKFIAWAQTPNTHSPADVFQATTSEVAPPEPPVLESLSPGEGPISGNTTVTLTGQNFVTGSLVDFAGNPATNVTLVNANTITCKTPVGSVCLPVDVTIETPGGSDTLPGGFTYLPTIAVLGTPCIGCDLTVFARGVPLGAWGVVKDDTLGPKYKKGLWWQIGFVHWEILHATWLGDSPLNGIGQGSTIYSIPNDPGLIGTPLYFEGVVDGNGPEIGKILILAELQSVTVVP